MQQWTGSKTLPNSEDIRKSVAKGSCRHGTDDQSRAEKGFDGFTGNDHDEVVQEAKADEGQTLLNRQPVQIWICWLCWTCRCNCTDNTWHLGSTFVGIFGRFFGLLLLQGDEDILPFLGGQGVDPLDGRRRVQPVFKIVRPAHVPAHAEMANWLQEMWNVTWFPDDNCRRHLCWLWLNDTVLILIIS